jgi:hypothetical protein
MLDHRDFRLDCLRNFICDAGVIHFALAGFTMLIIIAVVCRLRMQLQP